MIVTPTKDTTALQHPEFYFGFLIYSVGALRLNPGNNCSLIAPFLRAPWYNLV